MAEIKACYIGNIASHYRASIFSKMCEVFSCDFYFGQPFGSIKDIKTLPTSFFSTHAEQLQNIIIPVINKFWQKGAVGLLRKDYDVYIMFAEISYLSTWMMLVLNKLFFHKKIIFWGHGLSGAESPLKKRIRLFFYNLSDCVLVYGNRAIGLMEKEGIRANKLFPIHNSLDYEKSLEIIKGGSSVNLIHDHFKNTFPTIVFSGRLTASKKLEMIVDAVSRIKQDGNIINCVLIGSGSEENNLKELVRRKDLCNQFWFFGECYDEKVIGNIFWNATVCVSPGNVGLTAIHSLTYGCPVVTHDDFSHQGPEHEVIEPSVTGSFFECGNVESLNACIMEWCYPTNKNMTAIRHECQKVIQKEWNPDYQIKIIKEAIVYVCQ